MTLIDVWLFDSFPVGQWGRWWWQAGLRSWKHQSFIAARHWHGSPTPAYLTCPLSPPWHCQLSNYHLLTFHLSNVNLSTYWFGNINLLLQTLTRLTTPAFYQLITRTTLALSTVNFSPANFSPVNCQVSTCHLLLRTLTRLTTSAFYQLTYWVPPPESWLPNYQLITRTTLALSPVKLSPVNLFTFHLSSVKLSTVNQVTCHIISWHLSSRCQTASWKVNYNRATIIDEKVPQER